MPEIRVMMQQKVRKKNANAHAGGKWNLAVQRIVSKQIEKRPVLMLMLEESETWLSNV